MSPPIPPPLRVVIKGGFFGRELTHAEAEAQCLREAAKLAGSTAPSDRARQAELLEEAHRNRVWNPNLRLPERFAHG